jgi:hypothetical protein
MTPLTHSLFDLLLLLPLAVARTAEPPRLAEGLWVVHTVNTANPGNNKEESD